MNSTEVTDHANLLRVLAGACGEAAGAPCGTAGFTLGESEDAMLHAADTLDALQAELSALKRGAEIERHDAAEDQADPRV